MTMTDNTEPLPSEPLDPPARDERPVAYRYVHRDYAGRKVSRYGTHAERVNGHDPIEVHPLYERREPAYPLVLDEVEAVARALYEEWQGEEPTLDADVLWDQLPPSTRSGWLTSATAAITALRQHQSAEIDALRAENARLRAMLENPPKHRFWGAGEPDCPRDIKAGNGELHTLRCKVCGQDSPRDNICRAAIEGGAK